MPKVLDRTLEEVCEFCQKKFGHKTNKNRHIRRFHKKLVARFQCNLCFRQCGDKCSSKIHSIRAHGGHSDFYVIWLDNYKPSEGSEQLIALQIEPVN